MAEPEEKWAEVNPLIAGTAAEAPATPAPPRGWVRAGADTLIDFGRGVTGMAKQAAGLQEAAATAIDTRSPLAQQTRANMDTWSDVDTVLQGLQSPARREAERTGGYSFSTDPGKYIVQTATGMLPYVPLAAAGPMAAIPFAAMGFGQTRSDLRESLRNAPVEEMRKNPQWVDLVDSGMSDEDARERIYLDATDPRKVQTYLDAAPNVVGQGVTGGVGGAFMKGLTHAATRKITGEIATNAVQRAEELARRNFVTRRIAGAGIGAGAGAIAGGGQEISRQLAETSAGQQREGLDWSKVGDASSEMAAVFGTMGTVFGINRGKYAPPKAKAPSIGTDVEAAALAAEYGAPGKRARPPRKPTTEMEPGDLGVPYPDDLTDVPHASRVPPRAYEEMTHGDLGMPEPFGTEARDYGPPGHTYDPTTHGMEPGAAPPVDAGRPMESGDLYARSGALRPEHEAPLPFGTAPETAREATARKKGVSDFLRKTGEAPHPGKPIIAGGKDRGEGLPGGGAPMFGTPGAVTQPRQPARPRNISSDATFVGHTYDGRQIWVGSDGRRQTVDETTPGQPRRTEATKNSRDPDFRTADEIPPAERVDPSNIGAEKEQLAALMESKDPSTRGRMAAMLQRLYNTGQKLSINIFPEMGQRLFGPMRPKLDQMLHHDVDGTIDAIRGDVIDLARRDPLDANDRAALDALKQHANLGEVKAWGENIARRSGKNDNKVPAIQWPEGLRRALKTMDPDQAQVVRDAINRNARAAGDHMRGAEHVPGEPKYVRAADAPAVKRATAKEAKAEAAAEAERKTHAVPEEIGFGEAAPEVKAEVPHAETGYELLDTLGQPEVGDTAKLAAPEGHKPSPSAGAEPQAARRQDLGLTKKGKVEPELRMRWGRVVGEKLGLKTKSGKPETTTSTTFGEKLKAALARREENVRKRAEARGQTVKGAYSPRVTVVERGAVGDSSEAVRKRRAQSREEFRFEMADHVEQLNNQMNDEALAAQADEKARAATFDGYEEYLRWKNKGGGIIDRLSFDTEAEFLKWQRAMNPTEWVRTVDPSGMEHWHRKGEVVTDEAGVPKHARPEMKEFWEAHDAAEKASAEEEAKAAADEARDKDNERVANKRRHDSKVRDIISKAVVRGKLLTKDLLDRVITGRGMKAATEKDKKGKVTLKLDEKGNIIFSDEHLTEEGKARSGRTGEIPTYRSGPRKGQRHEDKLLDERNMKATFRPFLNLSMADLKNVAFEFVRLAEQRIAVANARFQKASQQSKDNKGRFWSIGASVGLKHHATGHEFYNQLVDDRIFRNAVLRYSGADKGSKRFGTGNKEMLQMLVQQHWMGQVYALQGRPSMMRNFYIERVNLVREQIMDKYNMMSLDAPAGERVALDKELRKALDVLDRNTSEINEHYTDPRHLVEDPNTVDFWQALEEANLERLLPPSDVPSTGNRIFSNFLSNDIREQYARRNIEARRKGLNHESPAAFEKRMWDTYGEGYAGADKETQAWMREHASLLPEAYGHADFFERHGPYHPGEAREMVERDLEAPRQDSPDVSEKRMAELYGEGYMGADEATKARMRAEAEKLPPSYGKPDFFPRETSKSETDASRRMVAGDLVEGYAERIKLDPTDPALTIHERELRIMKLVEEAERIRDQLDAIPLREGEVPAAWRTMLADKLKFIEEEIVQHYEHAVPNITDKDYALGRVLDNGSDLSKPGALPKGAYVRRVSDFLREGARDIRSGVGLGVSKIGAGLRNHLLRVAERSVGDMEVVALTSEQMRLAAEEKGLRGDTPAFYDPQTHRIFVSQDVMRSTDRARIMGHELTHPLTLRAAELFPHIARKLEQQLGLLREAHDQPRHPAHGAVRAALEGNTQALKNIHEFIGELYNDGGNVARALHAIETPAELRKKWRTDTLANAFEDVLSTIKRGLNNLFFPMSKKRLLHDATLNSMHLFERLEDLRDFAASKGQEISMRPSGEHPAMPMTRDREANPVKGRFLHGSPFRWEGKPRGDITWVTKRKDVANEYATEEFMGSAQRGGGERAPHVRLIDVDAKNVFDLRKPEHRKYYDEVIRPESRRDADPDEHLPRLRDDHLPGFGSAVLMKDRLAAHGFDGVWATEGRQGDTLALFRPEAGWTGSHMLPTGGWGSVETSVRERRPVGKSIGRVFVRNLMRELGPGGKNADPFLHNMLGKIEHIVGDAKVEVLGRGDFTKEAKRRGGSKYTEGFYLPGEHRVVLHQHTAPADVVHEMYHAATTMAMKAFPEFERLMWQLGSSASFENPHFAKAYELYMGGKEGKSQPYGFKDSHEYVAEFMANQAFREMLKHIPLTREQAKYIQRTLGESKRPKNLFQATLSSITEFLNKLWRRRKDPVTIGALTERAMEDLLRVSGRMPYEALRKQAVKVWTERNKSADIWDRSDTEFPYSMTGQMVERRGSGNALFADRPRTMDEATSKASETWKDVKFRLGRMGVSGALLKAHTFVELRRRAEQGMQDVVRGVEDVWSKVETTARNIFRDSGAEDIAFEIARQMKMPPAVFQKLQDYVNLENHWKVSGEDNLFEGKNAWVSRDSPWHEHYRERWAKLRDMYDDLTPDQKELRRRMLDYYEETHGKILRGNLTKVIRLRDMVPDDNPDTIEALVKYVLKEDLDAHDKAQLEKLPGYESEIDLTDKSPEHVQFRKNIRELRSNPLFKKVEGVWYPAKRRGNWVVEGRYDLEPIADRYGGRKVDENGNVFEFDDDAQAQKFYDDVIGGDYGGIHHEGTTKVVYKADEHGKIMLDAEGKPIHETYESERTSREGEPGTPGYRETKEFSERRVSAKAAEAAGGEGTVTRTRVEFNPLLLEFYENPRHAYERHAQLKAEDPNLILTHVEPKKDTSGTYLDPKKASRVYETLMNSLERGRGWDNMDETTRKMTRRDLEEAAITHIMSSSARSLRVPRRYALGADKSLLRDFNDYSRNSSMTLAEMHHRPDLTDALNEMDDYVTANKRSTGAGDEPSEYGELRRKIQTEVHNRVFTRPSEVVAPFWTKALARILQISYMDKLMSPGFVVLNASEPWVIGAPLLTGHHGFKAYSEIGKAYGAIGFHGVWGKGVTNAIKAAKEGITAKFEDNHTLLTDRIKGEKDAAQLAEMFDYGAQRGYFDRDAGMELAQRVDPSTSRIGQGLDHLDNVTRQVNAQIENVNRAVMAIASYRLGIEKGMSHEKAMQHAFDMVHDTSGNYGHWNTPAAFNDPRLKFALQFKRYAQRITANYVRMFAQAFSRMPSEQRDIARKQLGVMMGSQILFSGMLGLPTEPIKLALLATSPLTGFGPDEAEIWAREAMAKLTGDDQLAEGIMRGFPRAYLDIGIGTRLAHDSIWSHGTLGKKPDDWYSTLGHYMVGAPGSMLTDWAQAAGKATDAVGQLARGNTTQAASDAGDFFELAMPFKVGADTLSAARTYMGGPKTMTPAGQPKGYQPTLAQAALEAFGIRSGTQQEASDKRFALSQAKAQYNSEKNKAFQMYVRASTPGEKRSIEDAAIEASKKWPGGMQLTHGDFIKAGRRFELRQSVDPGDVGVHLTKKQEGLRDRFSFFNV